MGDVIKNLIKYDGISSYISLEGVGNHYKQAHLDGVQCLMSCKTEIEQIIRIKGKVTIDHHEIIMTPKGKSVEGQQLTGSKMFVVGNFQFKLEYLAQGAEKRVYITKFMKPFCEYIVLPEQCYVNAYMYPVAYIEDMYVKILDTQTLFYNASILFVAKLY